MAAAARAAASHIRPGLARRAWATAVAVQTHNCKPVPHFVILSRLQEVKRVSGSGCGSQQSVTELVASAPSPFGQVETLRTLGGCDRLVLVSKGLLCTRTGAVCSQ